MNAGRCTVKGATVTSCALLLFSGCVASSRHPGDDPPGISVSQIEDLRSFDSLLPVPPDSVAEMYRSYSKTGFYQAHHETINAVALLIDSLNKATIHGIDTLAIDHTVDNFGTAARSHHTLYISSSYFLLYPDFSVLRSVVMHEFGHILYSHLSDEKRTAVASVWRDLELHALMYVFVDGEYSGNAKFGGHPYESPSELYASAFNLFYNRPDELRARLRYVEPDHYELVDKLKNLVGVTSLVLFE
jgi:hypothetical protein